MTSETMASMRFGVMITAIGLIITGGMPRAIDPCADRVQDTDQTPCLHTDADLCLAMTSQSRVHELARDTGTIPVPLCRQTGASPSFHCAAALRQRSSFSPTLLSEHIRLQI